MDNIEDNSSMTFLEHFSELRSRLMKIVVAVFITSIIAFYFYTHLVDFLFKPFRELAAIKTNDMLYVNSLFEGFLTRLKISVSFGLITAFPFIIYQLLRFIFPGLHKNERKVISFSLFGSAVLIFLGVYYGYNIIIPISLDFLTGRGFIPVDVGILLNFEKNIFYIFQFLLSFLLLFQVPVVLILLMMMKLVSRKNLLKASRYVIVGIFILSAILTPPDFISQVSLSLPLVLLFFLSILFAKIFKLGEE